jgi:uncharacterized RDD family membrane protein YckC
VVPRWKDAATVPFLKAIIESQLEVEAPEPTTMDRLRATVSRSGVLNTRLQGVGSGRTATFSPATVGFRYGAGLIDGLIILLLAAAAMWLCSRFVVPVWGNTGAFYTAVLTWYGASLLFLTWTVGFHAQTPGQRFWGVMVIHGRGEQVFLGRAFAFALGTLLLGFLTVFWVALLPRRRSIGEFISGTRVVRTRVLHQAS